MSHSSFRDRSREKVENRSLGDKVHKATLHTALGRDALVTQIPQWESLRQRAREARLRALDYHDDILASFIRSVKERDISISLAKTPEEACEIIKRLVLEAGTQVIKSKSMTSEEIGLNPVLEAAGVTVTETDLGELIVQLAGEPPSHITAPAIHLSTEDIANLFRDKLGIEVPAWVDDPEPMDEAVRNRLAKDLSLAAREHLRQRFLQADVGISGANFLVGESGTVVLVENEGNIMLTTSLPKRHIVLAGIDKLIETEKDLGVLLRLLPVSATAQRQSCYVSLFADKHPDMHIVLIDHGRSELLSDERMRDLLTCIRCGACMNVCPVYRSVGGHAYDAAYPGPIGSLLMPRLGGSDRYGDLPFASSLCGACTEVCPVQIPLHRHLLEMRSFNKRGSDPLAFTMRLAASAMRKSQRMARFAKFYPFAKKFASFNPAAKAWLEERELPKSPKETFRSWWHRQKTNEPSIEDDIPNHSTTSLASDEQVVESERDSRTLLEAFQARMVELGPEGTSEVQVFDKASVAQEFIRIRMHEHLPEDILVQGELPQKKDYALGITSAVMLIADTGGMVMDFPKRQDAWPGMLARVHLVVAQPSQIVPTVAHALVVRSVKRKTGKWNDHQIIVTGPSRTADVEKVLVIPAHGPQKLVVVLCDEPIDLGSLRQHETNFA